MTGMTPLQIQSSPTPQQNPTGERSIRPDVVAAPDSSDPAPQSADTQAPAATQGRDPDLIYAGETIQLANGQSYTVKAGDTLSSIARATGTTVNDLIAANGMNAALTDGNPYTSGGPQVTPGTTTVDKGAPLWEEPADSATTQSAPASTPDSSSPTALDLVTPAEARVAVNDRLQQGEITASEAQDAFAAINQIEAGGATDEARKVVIDVTGLDVSPAETTESADPAAPSAEPVSQQAEPRRLEVVEQSL